MELVLFLFLAGLTIYLSFKLSYYADILNKTSNISGVFIGGILLAGLTSLPEFVTCLSSIFLNNPYLAIGDILGSNFFNISIMCLFDILFIKTMFYNYTKNKYYIIYLLLIINYFIMYLFMGGIFNLELFNIGIPSFIIIISYIIYLKKAQEKDSKKEIIKTKEHVLLKFLIVGILMVIVSIFLTLIVNLIADKNPNVASSFIGAILLGITTSMPEVITFIALIKMKSFDLALSDIIGSNLFNLLILAIGDIFLKNKEIYYFVDKESMFLLVFGFILTILSFYQNNRKVVKNKLIYIVPSLIGVLLYIYYIVINV
ncbi:MAG TPA: hypothetical protein OIM65_01445 [Bacilli bacterium]|nr:sodium/calcium exchanger protein [Mycoplasma sp. CAG:611]HJJ07967.1 hypothetical protein [Bacilli bacterium]